MSMTAGTTALESGSLAKAIYDQLTTAFGAPPDATQTTNREKAAAAIAIAVVGHVAANADVTIGTGDAGLQRDPSSSTDTLVRRRRRCFRVR